METNVALCFSQKVHLELCWLLALRVFAITRTVSLLNQYIKLFDFQELLLLLFDMFIVFLINHLKITSFSEDVLNIF